MDAIARAFRTAGVPWFVTGSFASSVHGEFRATNDVDIVAALEARHLSLLLDPLSEHFHVDQEQARRAVSESGSFNLIHRETYLKVDVFPCLSAFDREASRRAEPLVLPGAGEPLLVATREDILLAKLRWRDRNFLPPREGTGGLSGRQRTAPARTIVAARGARTARPG